MDDRQRDVLELEAPSDREEADLRDRMGREQLDEFRALEAREQLREEDRARC